MLGWELPPHHVGGMGVACYQMCKQLANTGVDIDFVLPYTADFNIPFMNIIPTSDRSYEDLKFAGGVYDAKNFGTRKSNALNQALDLSKQHNKYALSVESITKYAEFDIIHAHEWLTFKAAMAAKAVSGKPMIAHVHATQFDQSAGGYGNPEVREIEYAGLMMADAVFSVSQHTKDVLIREYGIPESKIHVVHNSMEINPEVNEASNLYRYLEIMKSKGYKVVVNSGRKTIQKGLTHLLDTAKRVVEKNPKVLFLLVGGGEQEEELLEKAAYLGISKNVIFAGWMNGTGKAWRDSFKIGDIFVMPSVSEPFGLAALEAVGYGTPTLVSRQSGVSEVLRNSLVCDYWDTDMMADMILNVVENDSLRSELWQNAYNEYKDLSWEKSANKMNGHYCSLVGV